MNEYGVVGSACSELVQGNTTLKIGIEQTTTRYIQRYTLIETLIPAIMCLFVGPYSDEHGRKLPIVRVTEHRLKVVPRLRESRLLAPSGHGARVHAT